MNRYLLIIALIISMSLIGGNAFAADTCCVKNTCSCAKSSCCTDGKCACKGGCCTENSCKCADGKCGVKCNC